MKYYLNLFLFSVVLVLLATSCQSNSESYEYLDVHKEYPKYKISEIVDSMVVLGVPRAQIIIPDSFLSVRLYTVNTGYVLNTDGEILDEKICHADYPNFQGKVVDELQYSSVSKAKTKIFNTYLAHMHNWENKPFRRIARGKYEIFMVPRSIHRKGVEPLSFYLKELKNVNGEMATVYYMFPNNYQEYSLSSFEYNRRRLVVMIENGEDFPEEKLQAYGIE